MLSAGVALVTITAKTLAWWLTGSIGLLSDAMESIVNLASALFGLLMVSIAHRPADEDHPFGHTKAEYFASGFEGLLIVAAAAAIVWAALPRLFDPQPLQQLGWGLALTVASSALNGVFAWRMLAAARVLRSVALEGDARHLFADVWTSAGVVSGVLLVMLTGWLWLDALIAIGVAVYILREGSRLWWGAVEGLMDRAAEPEVLARIEATLLRFDDPAIRFDHVITRRAGRRHFVDLHMHMPGQWSLARAAALRSKVEQALMAAQPGLRATIEVLPTDVETRFSDEEPAP